MARPCSSCGLDNPDAARFCMECGQSLLRTCSACGSPADAGARFCVDCGTPLQDLPTDADDQDHDPLHRATAARRQITVLFSDLVGSTALSEALDAEDYRELIAEYRRVVGRIAARYQGHVSNYVGDGIDILFGHPVAREDSARAAALAGLDIAREAASIGAGFPELAVETRVRIGLHTGAVVIGEKDRDGHLEQAGLFGDVPNIAARIQSKGDAGSVVCSDMTRRLIGPRLRFDSIGHYELHGVSEPTEIFRVLGASGVEASRFSSEATPLIGRGAELALVRNRWEAALDSDGQVVFISGEAGIGKSRIAFAFSDDLPADTVRRVVFSSSSLHRNTSYYCLRASLRNLIGAAPEDSAEDTIAKLRQRLDRMGMQDSGVLSALSRILQTGASDAPETDTQRAAIVAGALDFFRHLSRQRPLLIIMDDIHWVDPSTLEIVQAWFNEIASQRCLFIATARPEFENSLQGLAHVSSIKLNRLGKRDTLRVVEAVAGRLPPIQIQAQIIKRTDGIPLYVEELTRTVVASGDFDALSINETVGPVRTAIPDSLQASLLARLDRIGNARQIAQVAATIGRHFDADLLAAVCGQSRSELEPVLQSLIEAELVVQRGSIEIAAYSFRHALVQDAAYQSVLRADRARWHERVADCIEAANPDAEHEVLAYHRMQSGELERAEHLWAIAGAEAVKRSASAEAIAHFRNALRCLSHQPTSPARDLREMGLRLQAGGPLASVKGYAHRSVTECYTRAIELGRALGEQDRLFDALYGQCRGTFLAGDFKLARSTASMLLTLAEEVETPRATQRAHRSAGAVEQFSGQPRKALTHFEEITARTLPKSERQEALLDDVADIRVVALSYAALSHWATGAFGTAFDMGALAVEEARTLRHPGTEIFAQVVLAWLWCCDEDTHATALSAEAASDIGTRDGVAAWQGLATFLLRWSDHGTDQPETLITDLGDALEAWLSTGSRLGQTFLLTRIAEAHLRVHQIDEATECLNRAETYRDQSGEHFWTTGLTALAGDIAAAEGAQDEAVRHFATAMRHAQGAGLHGPALRVALRLARLLEARGDIDHALQAVTSALDPVDQTDRSTLVRNTLALRDRLTSDISAA